MYEILGIIGVFTFFLWMIYAGWSAPLMEETKEGKWKTIRPERTLKDLFKQKTKK